MIDRMMTLISGEAGESEPTAVEIPAELILRGSTRPIS